MATILDIIRLKNKTVYEISMVLFATTILWIEEELRFYKDTWDIFPQHIF